jgi:hypothetical protein
MARALSGGRTVAPGSESGRALRRQALAQLISEQWLIGEAATKGITIAAGELQDRLQRNQRDEFAGGAQEQEEYLRSTGQTEADLRRRAKAEIAEEKLRQKAISEAPVVTRAQVAAYYAQHKKSYLIREERKAYFNNTKHMASALRIKHEVEAGKRELISPSQRQVNEIYATAHVPPGNPYEKAIVSSKPRTVAGPYSIGNDFWLYEVVKIVPARQRTLGEVAKSIHTKLTHERQERALSSFISQWASTWSAKTNCSAGYVVAQCRNYRGSRADVEVLPSF